MRAMLAALVYFVGLWFALQNTAWPGMVSQSTGQNFTLEVAPAGQPLLTAAALEPLQAFEGSLFTVAVAGRNFDPGARILWAGQPLQTRRIGSTALTGEVPANFVATPETVPVLVENGSGLVSNELRIKPIQPLEIDPRLAPATVGVAYREVIRVSGGVAPYRFYAQPADSGCTAECTSPLPPGLTLDETTGEIAGTPTEQGRRSFTVIITDSTGSIAACTFGVPKDLWYPDVNNPNAGVPALHGCESFTHSNGTP